MLYTDFPFDGLAAFCSLLDHNTIITQMISKYNDK